MTPAEKAREIVEAITSCRESALTPDEEKDLVEMIAEALVLTRQEALDEAAKMVEKLEETWMEIEKQPRSIFEAFEVSKIIRELKNGKATS